MITHTTHMQTRLRTCVHAHMYAHTCTRKAQTPHMHKHVHMVTHIHASVYVHAHPCTDVLTFSCVNTHHMQIHTRAHTQARTCTYAYTHHIHTCTLMHAHNQTCSCTHTHACIHTCTHVCTHPQTKSGQCWPSFSLPCKINSMAKENSLPFATS